VSRYLPKNRLLEGVFSLELSSLSSTFDASMLRFFSRSRLLKGAAYAGCGITGLVASQACYVKVNFTLPPDATGPTTGVAQGTRQHAGGGQAHGKPSRKNLVFMGDSVVTGVGCRREVGKGPTLPRHVAEVVSDQLGVEVAWSALGETGADIPMLREQFIPLLRREVERCAASGERVDAVIVLCGLNDIKSCFLHVNPWRNPGSFRRSLHELVDAIHDVAGTQCAVLLPAMPIDSSPRFNRFWPLSSLVARSSAAWEQQKQMLAEQAGTDPQAHSRPLVSFQEKPSAVPAKYFSEDGMHPNDLGYAAWAEYIAQHLLQRCLLPRDSTERQEQIRLSGRVMPYCKAPRVHVAP